MRREVHEIKRDPDEQAFDELMRDVAQHLIDERLEELEREASDHERARVIEKLRADLRGANIVAELEENRTRLLVLWDWEAKRRAGKAKDRTDADLKRLRAVSRWVGILAEGSA